mgnify:CR=1 FL=1
MSTDDVTELWWPDDIRLVTDTDLQSKRHARGQLSDPSDYSVRLVETARLSEGLNTASATIDRGVRVQLAHLIDTRQVNFDRDTYDLAYTIPPASWLNTHRFETREVVGVEELPEDLDPDERSIAYTTAQPVYEMLQEASEQLDQTSSVSRSETDVATPSRSEGVTMSDIARTGIERLIGQA